jgi:hypothetical protein
MEQEPALYMYGDINLYVDAEELEAEENVIDLLRSLAPD